MEKKITLSPEQDAAANPTDNVWVQANAGTGKTSVLVQRLLRIFFRTPNVTDWGVLCLTYTKAAAGEMRNRILGELQKWAMVPDDELVELLDGVAMNKPATSDDIARNIFYVYRQPRFAENQNNTQFLRRNLAPISTGSGNFPIFCNGVR